MPPLHPKVHHANMLFASLRPSPDGTRLSILYGTIFMVIGVQLPYWPVWLAGRGMEPGAIGVLLGAVFWAKVITNPSIGHFVDAYGRRKAVMIGLAAASLGAFSLYTVADGFWALLAIGVIGGSLFAGLMPLAETLTMTLTAQGRLDYGRVRLWGSLTFIGGSLLGGWLLQQFSTPEIVLWMILAGLSTALAATVILPDPPMRSSGLPRPPFRVLFVHRPTLLFLAVASLTQASHTVYYGFATLHWRDAGLNGTLIGSLWALGVIAEIVLFAFSGRVVARLGSEHLLLFGAAGGVVRWTALAWTSDPLLLVPAQLLHAATFGCTHLGAMHFIARHVQPGLQARAQATYSSTAMGLAPGLGLLAAGPLYGAFGGFAFFAATAAAAAATACGVALVRTSRTD